MDDCANIKVEVDDTHTSALTDEIALGQASTVFSATGLPYYFGGAVYQVPPQSLAVTRH